MLVAIVSSFSAVSLDSDLELVGTIGHFQRAFNSLDIVVGSLSVVLQRVGERVCRLARNGARAGNAVSCTFIANEAVSGDGYGIVGQRSAVVNLLIISGGQRHGALGHLEGAVVGSIVIVRIRCLDLIFNRAKIRNARNRICPGRTTIGAVLNGRTLGHRRSRATIVGFAIVFSAVINSLDGHVGLGDGQRARRVGHSIVTRNTCDSSLFFLSQVVLRALGDVGDRRSFAERLFDSACVAIKRTRNGILTIQRRSVIRLAVRLGYNR